MDSQKFNASARKSLYLNLERNGRLPLLFEKFPICYEYRKKVLCETEIFIEDNNQFEDDEKSLFTRYKCATELAYTSVKPPCVNIYPYFTVPASQTINLFTMSTIEKTVQNDANASVKRKCNFKLPEHKYNDITEESVSKEKNFEYVYCQNCWQRVGVIYFGEILLSGAKAQDASIKIMELPRNPMNIPESFRAETRNQDRELDTWLYTEKLRLRYRAHSRLFFAEYRRIGPLGFRGFDIGYPLFYWVSANVFR